MENGRGGEKQTDRRTHRERRSGGGERAYVNKRERWTNSEAGSKQRDMERERGKRRETDRQTDRRTERERENKCRTKLTWTGKG